MLDFLLAVGVWVDGGPDLEQSLLVGSDGSVPALPMHVSIVPGGKTSSASAGYCERKVSSAPRLAASNSISSVKERSFPDRTPRRS